MKILIYNSFSLHETTIGKQTSKVSADARKTEKKIRNENSVRMCGKLKTQREQERERESCAEKIFFFLFLLFVTFAATLLETWEIAVTGDWQFYKVSSDELANFSVGEI